VDFATRRRSRSPFCLWSLGLFEESGCSTIDGGFLFHSSVPGSAARPPNS
jgi:hypothetical protein